MKFYCASGKHLLFDSEADNKCSPCTDLARRINAQNIMPNTLKLCKHHRENVQGDCHSCQFALDWNTAHRLCIRCGEPAVGYRVMDVKAPIEFFCDEHFDGIPDEAIPATAQA